MSCYCGDYSIEFYRAEMRMARKSHRCEECGGTVKPGEKYEYASGKCEGEMYDAKTCGQCIDLRDWVRAHVPCFCWEHHNLHECVRDTVEEYASQAPGLWFGAMRRLVKIRKRANELRMVA